jgi:phytoene dehydrogenase-like protein
VLLTAYPEAQRVLDYTALELHPFYDGALVRWNGRFHRVADPWRHPFAAFASLFSPIGALKDKLTVARLRSRACSGTLAALFQRPEMTSLRLLQTDGFSDDMINRFFSPFLGGVFLDGELQTSSRMLEFVFRMFALGQTALPAKGMEAIPQQLANSLPPESVRLHTRVTAVDDKKVTLTSGEQLPVRAVVVATEGPVAAQLLGESMNSQSRSVTCVYFVAEKSPVEEPILFLNGDGRGVVNDFCAPSVVAPTYAPPGAALLSATVLGNPPYDDRQLEAAVRDHLSSWFGTEVRRWRPLRTYHITHALPDQTPPALAVPERPVQIRRGLFVCGDHRDNASINGAMVSGRRAAEAVLAELRQ